MNYPALFAICAAVLFLISGLSHGQDAKPNLAANPVQIAPTSAPRRPPTEYDALYDQATNDQIYAVLSDDRAGVSAWLQAARRMIGVPSPQGGLVRPGSFSWNIEEWPLYDAYFPMGEALRSKTNPSVSDLLVKRISTAYSHTLPAELPAFASLALCLTLWDGKTHLADLRNFTLFLQTQSIPSYWNIITELYQKRLQLGDSTVVSDYDSLVFSPQVNKKNPNPLALQLLWMYPNDPGLSQVAQRIIFASKSPWVPIIKLDREFQLDGLLRSPLLSLEPFRNEIYQELQDKRVVDTCTEQDLDAVIRSRFQMSVDWSGPLLASPPQTTQTFEIRVCDVLAKRLSELKGSPVFELYWNINARDEAIKKDIQFLNEYGKCFQYDEQIPDYSSPHFPRLDHPATPDDVEAGRAIFSLENYHLPTRIIPIEFYRGKIPRGSGADENPVWAIEKSSGAIGRVWQAEAFFANGAWHKLLGIVFVHAIVGLADTDVSVNLEPEWFMTHSIQAVLWVSQIMGNFTVTSPLRIRIILYNHGTQPSAVPAPFHPGADPRTMPVRMSLTYTPFTTESVGPGAPIMPATVQLIPLPMSTPPLHRKQELAPLIEGGSLPPLAGGELTEFDLRDLFEIKLPGYYAFTIGTPTPESTNSVTYRFAIVDN